MLLDILMVVGTLICAVQAIRSGRLLISAIWLAGCSALVALLLYMLGSGEIAVIELSVGAGLVTVIFVFAINIAGEEQIARQRLIPWPVTWCLLAITVILLGWLILPYLAPVFPIMAKLTFAQAVWEQRELDTLLQIFLIFSGVLGLLGLLSDPNPRHLDHPSTEEPEVKS